MRARAPSARRIAGSVGSGGGPWPGGRLFPPPDLLEPEMLEEGEADQGEEGMVMEPEPGAPLEVIEPEFLLALLVRRFADPAGLDCPGQRAQAPTLQGWGEQRASLRQRIVAK